jgi:type II secretory pathway component GspD/PulD (secretin)
MAGPSTNLPPSGEGVPPAVPVGPVATSGPTGGALVVTEEESTHSLILTGPEWAVDRAMALLEQIDVPPHQVVIEAIIADVNRSYLKEKGIRWDFNSTVVGEGATGDDFGGIGFGTFGRQNFSFDADLFLGEESGKSKLLANPSLRAVDGAEGRIQIGDELRFQVLQPTSMGGQPVYTVETVDVGIILEFTPTITEDGRVRLELRAESSSVSGYTAGFPNIRKREARTELIIQNGETIVIGGLVSEDEIETLREVPLLSEIPILGQLFRHRSVERRPQELVFFITPRILYAADGTLNTDEQRLSSGKDTEPMGWVQELPEGLADRIIDTTAGTPVVVAPGAETATAPEPAPAPARIEEAPVDAANPDEIPTVGAVARRHGR